MENILEQINTSALKFLSPLTPENTYKTIVAEALSLVNADFGSIILEENGVLKRVYGSDKLAYVVQNRKKGNTYKSYLKQEVLVIPITEIAKTHPRLEEQGIKWTIFIPLSYQGNSIGVLTLNSSKDQQFTQHDMHVLKLFGSLATMAIRKTQLYTQTKNALETRDLFISLASHELRTPLTSINGYIQLLYSKLKDSQSPEGKWIKELYEESKRLTNLVTELLEINRIKQGQLQFTLQECTIMDFVDASVNRYRIINPDRQIIYSVEFPQKERIRIIGDPEKLLQMMTGLINNADKFSPLSEPISLIVKKTKQHLVVQVKDEGSGIAREALNHIFDGFYKAGQVNKEGLGVGMLLAKHIMTYHHGTLLVKSKVSRGTTIEARFPLLHI